MILCMRKMNENEEGIQTNYMQSMQASHILSTAVINVVMPKRKAYDGIFTNKTMLYTVHYTMMQPRSYNSNDLEVEVLSHGEVNRDN